VAILPVQQDDDPRAALTRLQQRRQRMPSAAATMSDRERHGYHLRPGGTMPLVEWDYPPGVGRLLDSLGTRVCPESATKVRGPSDGYAFWAHGSITVMKPHTESPPVPLTFAACYCLIVSQGEPPCLTPFS
jgi:hypothetical protein